MNICPNAEKCGGCTYQGVPYEQQLKEKEGAVRGLLSSAGFDPSICSPIRPCPDVYRYRNKMDYTFGDEVKDGPLQLGMHRKKQFMWQIMCLTWTRFCYMLFYRGDQYLP